MRSFYAVVIMTVLVLAANLAAAAGPTADAQTGKEIRDVLSRYARAYERKDLEAIVGMLAPGPDTTFVYPGPGGLHVGRSQIKAGFERDFEKFVSATIDYTSISTGSRGSVAWFVSEWVSTVDTGDGEFTIPARWTGVLEKRNGKWLFVLSQFSYEPVQPKEHS
jgi:uncharacterized protein (TIGR02246 family)